MGKALADFDYSMSSIESVGFALLDPKALAQFLIKLPRIIAANECLKMIDDLPSIKEMPWRSF